MVSICATFLTFKNLHFAMQRIHVFYSIFIIHSGYFPIHNVVGLCGGGAMYFL
jgi:hypothetical protein